MEIITFPDVEAVVVDYLTGAFAMLGESAVVATMVPNPRPSRLVRVTRTGGVRATVGHELPQVTLECWDSDGPGVANLASVTRGCIEAMHVSENGATVAFVREISGPTSFPDALTGLPRYRLTVQIVQKSQTH